MRFLRNMRNEYPVFAERLLEWDNRAPGLTPSNLFPLVAYKNFHLNDLDQVSRRSTTLIVSASTAQLGPQFGGRA